MDQNTARALMKRNVDNLNAGAAHGRALVQAMLDADQERCSELTEAFLQFLRGLDDDAREQMTMNAFTTLAQVQSDLQDRRRNG